MGYRSDVAIAMYKKDFEVMCEKAKQHEDSFVYEFVMQGYEQAPQGKPEDEHVYLYWEWVKWYDGYTEVNFIQNFLYEEGVPYDFVRIGEDHDDTECILNSEHYWLDVDRKVSFEY